MSHEGIGGAYLKKGYVDWLWKGRYDPAETLPPDCYPSVYRGRVLLWQWEDVAAERREAIRALAEAGFAPAGEAWVGSLQEGRLGLILFLADHKEPIAGDVSLWLCARELMEKGQELLGEPGRIWIGQECHSFEGLYQSIGAVQELSQWWNRTSPLPPQEMRLHRGHLQAYIKKGQFNYIPGYLARRLKGSDHPQRDAWALIPPTLEAVWAENEGATLSKLLMDFSWEEMRKDAALGLKRWVGKACLLMKAMDEDRHVPPIDRVVESIRKDCSLPYSQTNLAESLGLTPAYFCRLFREKTGVGFARFLLEARMEHAKSLLREDSAMGLEKVSQACGFSYKSYFCHCFKQETGMTPKEYQRTSQELEGRGHEE